MALSAAGCGWSPMEGWSGNAIWSDDDTAALAVYEFYEGRNTVTHTKKRNMESEVHLFPNVAAAGDSRLVLPRARGWAGPLYLMQSRGYAIVHRQERLPDLDDGMNRTANFTAHKITLNGAVTALGERRALRMISCDPEGQSAVTTGDVLTFIPSPDGRLLAKLETNATCAGKTGQLTFLDADTLEVLDGPIDLPPVEDVNMLMNRGWSEGGRFRIAQTGFLGPQGDSYAPGTAPEPTGEIDYGCYFPESNSSSVNARGETLDVSEEGALQVREARGGEAVFGCP